MASSDGNEALSSAILEAVERHGSVNTLQLASSRGRDHQDVVGCMKSLSSLGDVSNDSGTINPPVLLSKLG